MPRFSAGCCTADSDSSAFESYTVPLDVALPIVLSFGFYIPVVLWADAVPLIGMLMIPKTCAYVRTVLIGYSAMKKECG